MPIYGALPRAEYRQQPKRQPRGLGFERYSLLFDGTNYGRVPHDVSLDMGANQDFSIEAVVRTGDVTVRETICSKYAGVGGYIFGLRDTKINLYMNDGAGTNYYSNLINLSHNGQWMQVAVAADRSGNAQFYLNELPFGTDDISLRFGSLASLAPFDIGEYQLSNFWIGDIAYLRVYRDYLLTQKDVEWNRLNYHNPVHPEFIVLWFPFEEGAGLVAGDHSGLGNDGALLPALSPPTWEPVKKWELRVETE